MKSSTAGSPAFFNKISTFCSASFSALWQARVNITPRSKAASDSSRGKSPCSKRSTSSSKSRMAVSKSGVSCFAGFGVGMAENGTHALRRGQTRDRRGASGRKLSRREARHNHGVACRPDLGNIAAGKLYANVNQINDRVRLYRREYAGDGSV